MIGQDFKDANILRRSKRMRIAVTGCVHGELDTLYAELERREEEEGKKVDLVICTGDFQVICNQAIRDQADLETLTCPRKYLKMGDFHKYYSGEKIAPVLTLFIGGNHEAIGFMSELARGGWAAENIYYIGRAGVLKFGEVRIGGISGIFNQRDYQKPLPTPPYCDYTLRSAYYYRESDLSRLLRLQRPVHIFLSHDWPQGIYHSGDTVSLISKKRFLEREIRASTLGSPPLTQIMQALKP
jgi:lariat debranching enzyme